MDDVYFLLSSFLGWMRGFEPPASSSTDWRSNQLSYIHHAAEIIYVVWEPVKAKLGGLDKNIWGFRIILAVKTKEC